MDRFPAGSVVLVAFGVLLCSLFVGLFSLGSFGEAPLTGQATHETYNAFSTPEDGFLVTPSAVSASDTVVYENAWYSVNGSAWQPLVLSGSAYGSSSSWLSGAASVASPPALSESGEHYVIIYSCSRVADAWDCHGDTPATGGWQLQVVTISSDSCGGATCAPEEYCSAQNVCLLSVPGNTYFVAVSGSDSNPGNFTHPFATWQKAVVVSQPGDITYFRGGTYQPTTHILRGGYDTGTVGMVIDPEMSGFGASGTPEAPIRYFNYPGERPILDGSLLGPSPYGWQSGISMNRVQHIYLRGLTVSHIRQGPPGFPAYDNKNYSEAYGIGATHSANLLFENMVSHDIDGRGYAHNINSANHLFGQDNTTWINCDAYNLFDQYSTTPGNAADGWKTNGNPGDHFTWEGCRAFNYSDDGFDPSGDMYRTFKNCWAMSSDKYEGLSEEWDVEGNGFKMTGVNAATPNYALGGENYVRMENSIAAYCTGVGFYNDILVNYDDQVPNNGLFYNNFAYMNNIGFSDGGANVGGTRSVVYRNNIAYGSTSVLDQMDPLYEVAIYRPSIYDARNNTWIPTMQSGNDAWPGWEYNPAYSVSDVDFVSLDASQLMAPRKADGSLPDIEFGHLRADSDLIDGGTVIPGYHCATAGAHPGEECFAWYDEAPDLGPFEHEEVACVPTTESCNTVDDDCDGLVDDVVSSSRSCSVGVGACLRTGTQSSSCALGVTSWGSCSVVAGSPGNETCNSIDDDCDGTVDDAITCETITGFTVDHTSTDISEIPACWINKAKTDLHIAYAHTSHGSQIVSGMQAVNSYNNLYDFSTTGSATELQFEDYAFSGMPPLGGCQDLSQCDGGSSQVSQSRAYLDASGNQEINVVMWSWCSIAGHDIPLYLQNMRTLIAEYENGKVAHPTPVNFVFMTGHAEGGGVGDSSDSRNTLIRNFVNDRSVGSFCSLHTCILFDFADIENYDPDNNYFLDKRVEDGLQYDCVAPYTSGTSDCNWATEYLTRHPGSKDDTINDLVPYCAHSPEGADLPEATLNCALKGQAAWHMFARMAGWDGVSTTC